MFCRFNWAPVPLACACVSFQLGVCSLHSFWLKKGATNVTALSDLLQGQMRDLKELSTNVADLGKGQVTLTASMSDLNRKLDLLLAGAPAARRLRANEGTVVDLVSSGAPAAREAGDHHSEAPDPKQLRSDSGSRSRSSSRVGESH